MRIRSISPLFLALLAACGSTASTRSSVEPVAPTPEPTDEASSEGMFEAAEALVFGADEGVTAPVDRFAPLPERVWTGAFSERSLLLARSIRIEGPAGLLEHVAVASDDELYERYVETTADGFLQVVQRASDEVEVVRGSLDAWRLAAEARVTVLERMAECPVRIVAAGDVLWRDIDGNLVRSDRIELVGELGNMAPVRPRTESTAPTLPNTQVPVPQNTQVLPITQDLPITPAGSAPPVLETTPAFETTPGPEGTTGTATVPGSEAVPGSGAAPAGDDETRDDDDAPNATNTARDGTPDGGAAPGADAAATDAR
ncbi:MAG: hypothetical protein AAFU73_10630 [Planctomycetota bacterium]